MATGRYFVAALGTAMGVLASLWAWTFFVPLAYLDPEYPYWRAKLALLDRCDLGDVVVLGDSRAAAAIVPALLPFPATNLAVGGGKPIEALAALRRVLDCPVPPRRVVISFDAGHFMKPDLFWERSVRFGWMGPGDLDALIETSRDTGDWSVWNAHRADTLPPGLRSLLHTTRFPTIVLGNLFKAGGALRWQGNTARLQAGIAARGHYAFGTQSGSAAVALDASLDRFSPAPVLARGFEQMLALLEQRNIAVDFIAIPMNEATHARVQTRVRDGFAAFLAASSAQFPLFQVVGEPMPHWPDAHFGDAFAHLNPDGAALFSAWFGGCLALRMTGGDCAALSRQPRLQAAPPSTQNDAQYGWFSDTGRVASAKVRPSSNRGS